MDLKMVLMGQHKAAWRDYGEWSERTKKFPSAQQDYVGTKYGIVKISMECKMYRI